jgi:hypothetical protein
VKPSRIHAVDHVHLDAPPGIEDALRWFYVEIGQLEEIAWRPPEGLGLAFKSARIELRIRLTQKPVIEDVKPRVTLLVPSLTEAKTKLEERRVEVAELTGIGWADQRLQTVDPGGNRVELKREWPFSPL